MFGKKSKLVFRTDQDHAQEVEGFICREGFASREHFFVMAMRVFAQVYHAIKDGKEVIIRDIATGTDEGCVELDKE